MFTPLSGGRININTASATQLQIIPQIDETLAQAIVQVRAGLDGADGTEDDEPFRSPAEIGRIPQIPPEFAQQIAIMFTVKSSVFEVTVEARIDSDHRTYVGWLWRKSPRDIDLIRFDWK